MKTIIAILSLLILFCACTRPAAETQESRAVALDRATLKMVRLEMQQTPA